MSGPYTCLDCRVVVGDREAVRAHHVEKGHGKATGYESPVRKLPLTKEQLENVKKHGVPIYTVVMPDGSHIRLFAETANGIHGYNRYNEIDGNERKDDGEGN